MVGNTMTQQSNGSRCMGLLFIIVPILALTFGTNEPALQTDQAAIVMTLMIVLGVIMLASSGRQTTTSTQSYSPTPQTTTPGSASSETQTVKFCPYCGAQITKPNAKFCAECGSQL